MTILGYIESTGRRDKTEISGKHLFRERSSGSVQFNDKQYFGNVPLNAWEFYMGGYQPAQKMAQRPPRLCVEYGGDTALPEDYCGAGGDGEGYE